MRCYKTFLVFFFLASCCFDALPAYGLQSILEQAERAFLNFRDRPQGWIDQFDYCSSMDFLKLVPTYTQELLFSYHDLRSLEHRFILDCLKNHFLRHRRS